MPKPSNKPVAIPGSVGLSTADRASLKTSVGLELALDHIERIYQQKILMVYGCGLVLGFVSDEFDKFMELEPARNKAIASFSASLLLVAVFKSFAAFPPFSSALGAGATVAEGILALTDAIAPPSSDHPEPDEGLAKYLREKSLKMPLFQKILSRRFELEYERLNKRKEFLNRLDKELQNSNFSGTPQTLAIAMFGAAPAELKTNDIYSLFLKWREKMFKAMLMKYVRDNVTILWMRKQFRPGAGYELETYSLSSGLNEAQWRAMYGRFGKAPAPEAAAAFRLFTQTYSVMLVCAPELTRRYFPVPDPTLTGVVDLWRLWGAQRMEMDSTWYGTTEIKKPTRG